MILIRQLNSASCEPLIDINKRNYDYKFITVSPYITSELKNFDGIVTKYHITMCVSYSQQEY